MMVLSMTEHDPILTPRTGDIVRSKYDSIGERHVISANDCGIQYYRVRPTGKREIGYCLPGIWTKWCRAHRVSIEQRGSDNEQEAKE